MDPDSYVEFDDESSTANTDDKLLNSKSSSQTISASIKTDPDCFQVEKRGPKCCGAPSMLVIGFALITIGITSLIWTPFEIMMDERLRMTPGLPPYEWWKTPPEEVLIRIYVFNVTNSEEFLNGTAKIRLQEIGPIIFREILSHTNVTFNENGTLTYVAKRTAVFLPEKNEVDLNGTLILPNFPLLGVASYLADASFFTKMGFNVLMHTLKSEVMISTSVYDYLWNFSDPILDACQTIAPFLVPVKNMGIINRIYDNFEDTVTVYYGSKWGDERFFLIDKYDGTEFLPGHGTDCKDTVVDSTEGVVYPQFITKNYTPKYWRKTICRVTSLNFEKEVRKYGVTAYKFSLPDSTYNRTKPNDCYAYQPTLPNGVSDVSKCYYDFPIAASFPHFLYGDEVLKTFVDGLQPDVTKHESFVVIEPTTGIPFTSRARSQSNTVVRELSGFRRSLHKFSNTILPMFWVEYNQVSLPFHIQLLIFCTVIILPYWQVVMSACFITVGVAFVVHSLIKLRRRSHFGNNARRQFENELFLEK